MFNRNLVIVLGLLIIFMNFMSCSWFESSRKINMTPFSDNAGTLFGEAAKIGRPFKWKRLKRYTKLPEFQKATVDAAPIIRTLKGIVYYSNQVVAINNSGLKDKEKNQHLARYLSNIIEQSIEKGSVDSMGMDMESLNKILQDIPQQKTYLDGIATASPIINGVVRTMQERLDRVQEIVAEILALFDRMVYDEFAMTRINYISLKKLQMRSMRAVTMIYDGIMGEPASLDSLFIMDRSLQKFFQKDKKITIEQTHCCGKVFTRKTGSN